MVLGYEGSLEPELALHTDTPNLPANGGPFWGSAFSYGAPFGMYDGSVRMITFDNTGILKPLLTHNQGDLYTGP